MIDKLVKILNECERETTDLLVAWQSIAVEAFPEKGPSDMIMELKSIFPDAEIDALIADLESNLEELEKSTLLLLSDAWEDVDLATSTAAALEQSHLKMPIIEVGLACIVCVYGMYILSTKGKRREEKRVTRRSDGTFETVEISEYAEVGGVMQDIVEMFKPKLP